MDDRFVPVRRADAEKFSPSDIDRGHTMSLAARKSRSLFRCSPLGSWPVMVLVLATGCLGPDPLPQVRTSIVVGDHVIQRGETTDLTLIFTNEGPGPVLIAVYCPSFTVRDEAGNALEPGVYCLAVVPMPIRLEAGARHVIETSWNGRGNTGGTILGTLQVYPNALAITEGEALVQIESEPAWIKVVR